MKLILITAAVALSLPAAGQTARRPFVSATGRASVFATPDQVKIDASITTEGPTAQEATAKNADAMNALLGALRKLLGSTADIKTINFNVYPMYRSAPNQPPAITGYSASNTVEVTLAGTFTIGAVIDTAAANGATSVGALQFTLRDSEPARLQALRMATQQAKTHADAIASGTGRTTGNIISIQEAAGVAAPVVYTPGAGGAAGATPTTVLTGTIEVQATVVLEAELD